MPQKRWIRLPEKAAKPQVPADEKLLITQKCQDFIDTELKPKYVVTNPERYQWQYIIDVSGKWNRNFFYFSSLHKAKDENYMIRPTYEAKFARLEYTGKDCFSLAYMRHTDKWWEMRRGLSLEECFELIKTDHILQPMSI